MFVVNLFVDLLMSASSIGVICKGVDCPTVPLFTALRYILPTERRHSCQQDCVRNLTAFGYTQFEFYQKLFSNALASVQAGSPRSIPKIHTRKQTLIRETDRTQILSLVVCHSLQSPKIVN